MRRIGLIAGTGMGKTLDGWAISRRSVTTVYGDTVALEAVRDGETLIVLPRHGEGHTVPPHRVNYHANIAAMRQLGCAGIIATNAVGSLRTDLLPGAIVVLDDFIDFTRGRPVSYHDHQAVGPLPVRHTDMSKPYCADLRAALIDAGAEQGARVRATGTYVCTDGPRYESPAEVRLFGSWGGDVVGMTGLPEAVFAREAGLCYAAICIVTNLGAGLSPHPIAHGAVADQVRVSSAALRDLILSAIRRVPQGARCSCQSADH